MPGSTSVHKSLLMVPMITGTAVRGLIALADPHHEHVFDEGDVRLLQTLSGSMAVALENARLFAETQRLLKETERRNAELAVINSIQQGMAAELSFQAHRRPRRRQAARGLCAPATWGSTGSTEAARPDHAPVRVRARRARSTSRRSRAIARPADRQAAAATRQPVRARTTAPMRERARDVRHFAGTDMSRSAACRCRSSPATVSSARSSSRTTSASNAFGDADVRLLSTVAASMGVGARERAPVRRDAAPAQGNRAAQRRAGGDQQHPAGHGGRAQLPGHRRPRRRQAARGVRAPTTSASAGSIRTPA